MFSAGSNVFDSLRYPNGSDENASSLSTMRSIPELPYNYPSSDEHTHVEHGATVGQQRKLQFTSVRCLKLGKTDYNCSNRQLLRSSSEPNITTSSMSKTFTRTTKSFTVILSHSAWDVETNSARFSSFASSASETYTTCHTKNMKRNPLSSEKHSLKNKKQTPAPNDVDTQRRKKLSFNHSQNKHSNKRGKSKRNAITYSPRSAAVVKKSRAFNCKKFTMAKEKSPLIFSEKTAAFTERAKAQDRSNKDQMIAKCNETNKDSPRPFTGFASILSFWENREGFGIANAIHKMFGGFRESGGKNAGKTIPKEYESDVTTFHSINEAKLVDQLHVDELLSKESKINIFSSARENEFILSPMRADHLNSTNQKSKDTKRKEMNAGSNGTKLHKAIKKGVANTSGKNTLSRARSRLDKAASDLGTESQLCVMKSDVLHMAGHRIPELEANEFKRSSPPYEDSVKHKASSRFLNRPQEPKLVVRDCKGGPMFKVSALASKQSKSNTIETVEEKNESVGETVIENRSQGIDEGSNTRNSNVADKPSTHFIKRDHTKGSLLDDQSKNENSSKEKGNMFPNRQTLETVDLRNSYNCLETSSMHYGIVSKRSSEAENAQNAYQMDMENESKVAHNLTAAWARRNGGHSESSYDGNDKFAIESQSRDWYLAKLEKHCRRLKESSGKKIIRSRNRKHFTSKKLKSKKSQDDLQEHISYCQSPPIYTLESSQCRLDLAERKDKPMDIGDCIYSLEQTSCADSDVRIDECPQQPLPPKTGECELSDFMRITVALQETKNKFTPTPLSEKIKPPLHNARMLTPVPYKLNNSLGAAPDDTQEAASYPEPCKKSRHRSSARPDQGASKGRRNRQRSNYALTKPRSASESKEFTNDVGEPRKSRNTDEDLMKIIQRLTKHVNIKSRGNQLPRSDFSVDTCAPWDKKGSGNTNELPFFVNGANTALEPTRSSMMSQSTRVNQTPGQILRSFRANDLGCFFYSTGQPQQQQPRQQLQATQAFNTLPLRRFDQVTETTSSREPDCNFSEDMNAMKSSSDDVLTEPGQYYQINEMPNQMQFGNMYSDHKYEQCLKQERNPSTLHTGRHSSLGGSPVVLTSVRLSEKYTPQSPPSHHSPKVDTFLPKSLSNKTTCNEVLKPPPRKQAKSEILSVVSTQTDYATGECKATQVIDTCSGLCIKEEETYETSVALTETVCKDCKLIDAQCQCPSADVLDTEHSSSPALSIKCKAELMDRSCQCTSIDKEAKKLAQHIPVDVQDKIVGTSPKENKANDDDDVSNNVLVKDLYVLLLQNYTSKEDSTTALVDSKGREMHVRLNMQGRECSQSLKNLFSFFECSMKKDDVELIQRQVEALEQSVENKKMIFPCDDHGDTKGHVVSRSPVLPSQKKKELKSPGLNNKFTGSVQNLHVHDQTSAVNRTTHFTEENAEQRKVLQQQNNEESLKMEATNNLIGLQDIKELVDVLNKITFGHRDSKQHCDDVGKNIMQRLCTVLEQSNVLPEDISPSLDKVEKKTKSDMSKPVERKLSPKETFTLSGLIYKCPEETCLEENYQNYDHSTESASSALNVQYGIESTGQAVYNLQQNVAEVIAPALNKLSQHVIESVDQPSRKQQHHIKESTDQSSKKQHHHVTESADHASKTQHTHVIESTDQASKKQHQHEIASTNSAFFCKQHHEMKSTSLALNKEQLHAIVMSAQAINKRHQHVIESTHLAGDKQPHYIIEPTAQAVNKHHQHLIESTFPSVDKQHQHGIESTAQAVNNQHEYVLESTVPSVYKQHDHKKPTIYLHHNRSNVRKLRRGVYQPKLKVGLSPTCNDVDTLVSAKKASSHIEECSLHSPRPLLRYFQSFSESTSDSVQSARKSPKSETAQSNENRVNQADDLEVDVEYVISTGLDYNSDSSSKSTEPSQCKDERLLKAVRCGTCLHSMGDVSTVCSCHCRHKCVTGIRCMLPGEHGVLKRSEGALHLAPVGKVAAHGHATHFVNKKHAGVHETHKANVSDCTGLAGQSDKYRITRHIGEDKTHFDKRRKSNMYTLPPSSKRPHKPGKDNCAQLTGDYSELRDTVFSTKASDVDSCHTLQNDMDPTLDMNIAPPESESIGNETTQTFSAEVERIQYHIKPCNDDAFSNQYYIKDGKRFFMTSTSISSDPMTPVARETHRDHQRRLDQELTGHERKLKRRSQYTSSHMKLPVVGGSPSFVIHCSKTCLSTTEDAFDNCYQLKEEHEETMIAKQTLTNVETSVYSPGLTFGRLVKKKTNDRIVAKVKRSKTMDESSLIHEDTHTFTPDHNIRSDEILVSHQTKTRGETQRKSLSRQHRHNVMRLDAAGNLHKDKIEQTTKSREGTQRGENEVSRFCQYLEMDSFSVAKLSADSVDLAAEPYTKHGPQACNEKNTVTLEVKKAQGIIPLVVKKTHKEKPLILETPFPNRTILREECLPKSFTSKLPQFSSAELELKFEGRLKSTKRTPRKHRELHNWALSPVRTTPCISGNSKPAEHISSVSSDPYNSVQRKTYTFEELHFEKPTGHQGIVDQKVNVNCRGKQMKEHHVHRSSAPPIYLKNVFDLSREKHKVRHKNENEGTDVNSSNIREQFEFTENDKELRKKEKQVPCGTGPNKRHVQKDRKSRHKHNHMSSKAREPLNAATQKDVFIDVHGQLVCYPWDKSDIIPHDPQVAHKQNLITSSKHDHLIKSRGHQILDHFQEEPVNERFNQKASKGNDLLLNKRGSEDTQGVSKTSGRYEMIKSRLNDIQTKTMTTHEESQHVAPTEDANTATTHNFDTRKVDCPGQGQHHKGQRRNRISSRKLNKCKQYGVSEVKLVPEIKEASALDDVGRYRDVEIILGKDIPYEKFANSFVSGIHHQLNHTSVGEEDENDPLKCEVQLVIDKIFGNESDGKRQSISKQFTSLVPHQHGVADVAQSKNSKEELVDGDHGADLNTCSSHGHSKDIHQRKQNADQNWRHSQSSRETSSRLLSRNALGKPSRETYIGDAPVKLDELVDEALPRYNFEKNVLTRTHRSQCVKKPNWCVGYFNASKSASDSFISLASPAVHKPSNPSHAHTSNYTKQLLHHSATLLASKGSDNSKKSQVKNTLERAHIDVGQSGEPFTVNLCTNSGTFVRKFPVEVFTISKPDGYKLDKITKVNNTLANTTASPFYVGNILKAHVSNIIEPTGNEHKLKKHGHECGNAANKPLADGCSDKRGEKNREKLQMYGSKHVSGAVRADLTQTFKEDRAASKRTATVHYQAALEKSKKRLYDVILEKEKESSVISDGGNSDNVQFKDCAQNQQKEKIATKKHGFTEKLRTNTVYRHLENNIKPKKLARKIYARGKAPVMEPSPATTIGESTTLITSSELPSMPESHDLMISGQKDGEDKRGRDNTSSPHYDGYEGSLETTQDEHRQSPGHFNVHKASKLSPSLIQKQSDSHSWSLKLASGPLTPDKVNQITQLVNNIINQRSLGPDADQKVHMKVPSAADFAVQHSTSEDKIEIDDTKFSCPLPAEVASPKSEEAKVELASKVSIQEIPSDLKVILALDKEAKARSPVSAEILVSESSKNPDLCHQKPRDTSNTSLRDSASKGNVVKERHSCKYLQMSVINKVTYDPVPKSASASLQETTVSKESIAESLNDKNEKVASMEATVSGDSKSEEKKSSVSESKADSVTSLHFPFQDKKSGEEVGSEDVSVSHTQREFILKAPCSFYTQASNVSVTLDTSTKHGEKKKCVKLKVPKMGDVVVEADTDDDGPPKIVAENGYVHVSFGKSDPPAHAEVPPVLKDELQEKPTSEIESDKALHRVTSDRSATNDQDEPTPRIFIGSCSKKREKPDASNQIIQPDRAGANNSKSHNESVIHKYQKSSAAPAQHTHYTSPISDKQLNASSHYDAFATKQEEEAKYFSNSSTLEEKRSFYSATSPQQQGPKEVEHIDIFSVHKPLSGIMSKPSTETPSKIPLARYPQKEPSGLKNFLKSLEGDSSKTPSAFFSTTRPNIHGSESRKLSFLEANNTTDNKVGQNLNNGTDPLYRGSRQTAARTNNTDIGSGVRKRMYAAAERIVWDSSQTIQESIETNAEARHERTRLPLSGAGESKNHSYVSEKPKLFETKSSYDRNNVFNYDMGKAHQTGSDAGKASQAGTDALRSLVKENGVDRAPQREKRADIAYLKHRDVDFEQARDFVAEMPRRRESRVHQRDNAADRMLLQDSGSERVHLREKPYLRDTSTERFQKTDLGLDRVSILDPVIDRPSFRETDIDRAYVRERGKERPSSIDPDSDRAYIRERPTSLDSDSDRAYIRERNKEIPTSVDSDSDRGYKATAGFERAYIRDAAIGKTRVRDSSAVRTNTRDIYRSRMAGIHSSKIKPGLGDFARSASPAPSSINVAKLLDADQASFQNMSSAGQTNYHYSSMASPSAQPKYPLAIRVDATPKLKLNVQQEVSAEPFTSSSLDSDMELKFPVGPPLEHRQVKNEFWKRPFAKNELSSSLIKTSPKTRMPERYKIKQISTESYDAESILTKLASKELSSNETPNYYRPLSVGRDPNNSEELKTDFLGIRRRFFSSIPSPDKRSRPAANESSISEDGSESESQSMKGVGDRFKRVRPRYSEKRMFSRESSGDSSTSYEDLSNDEEQRSVPLIRKSSEDFFQQKQFDHSNNVLFSGGFNDLRKSIKEKEQRVMSQLTGVVPKQHPRKSLNPGRANRSVSNMRLASNADQSRQFFERAKDFLSMDEDTNVSAPTERRYGRLVKGTESRRTGRDFSDTELSSPEKPARPYFERNSQFKPSSSKFYDNAKRASDVGIPKDEPERFNKRQELYPTRMRQDSPLPLTDYSSEEASPTIHSSQWRKKAEQLREATQSDSDENMTSNSDKVSSDCSDTDLPHRPSATNLSPKLQNSSNALCRSTRLSQSEASSKNVRKSEPATEIFIKSTRTADRCGAMSPTQADRETPSPRRTPHSSLASSKSPRAGLYRVRFSDEVQQFNIPNVDGDCGKFSTHADILDSNRALCAPAKPVQDSRDCFMNRKLEASMMDADEYGECEDEAHSHLNLQMINDICNLEQGYRQHGAESAPNHPQRVADLKTSDTYLPMKKHFHPATKPNPKNKLYRMSDPNYSQSNMATAESSQGQGAQGHDWADSGYSTLSTPNEFSGISEWDIAIQKKLAMRREQLKKKIISEHY